MLIRISLIVAILAGLAVGVLNFTQVKTKVVALQTDLSNTKTELATTQGKLSTSEKNLAKSEADLKHTKQELADSITERDAATAKADASDKRAQKAMDDLANAQKKLDDALALNEQYRLSGLTPEQALNAAKTLKEIQAALTGTREENKMLGQKIRKLETELAIYKTPDYHVPLPATAQGQVVVSDPKWDFVVVNIGEDQGVLEHGELLVNRNGKLIAKVEVRSVQKSRAIANVVPGWKVDENGIMEGDSVIPAYPSQM